MNGALERRTTDIKEYNSFISVYEDKIVDLKSGHAFPEPLNFATEIKAVQKTIDTCKSKIKIAEREVGILKSKLGLN